LKYPKRKITAATLFAILSSALYAAQPSFECSNVNPKSCEAIICKSATLGRLDHEMAALYHQAAKTGRNHKELVAHQRAWIKERNTCHHAKDAIAYMQTLYQRRIDELKERYQLGEGSPKHSEPDQALTLQGLRFKVDIHGEGSIREVAVTVEGLEGGKKVLLKHEIEGSISGTDTADLNKDGYPELYLFVTSPGSGSYGDVIAWSSNKNRSITPVTFPELDPKSKESKGYMGHDSFTIKDGFLVRSFPVYGDNDPNCCPTGGTRELYYELVPGEAAWQLKLAKSKETKKKGSR
jgi:uncharacterized protein